jgi:integrase
MGVLTALATTSLTAPEDDPAIRALVAALTAQVTKQVRAELAEDRRLGPQRAPEPARTMASLWEEWFPTLPIGSSRWKNARVAARLLDMPVKFGGRTITLGECSPADMVPALLEAWKSALHNFPGERGPLGVGTRDSYRMTVQACLTYFVKIGTLDKNPFHAVPREPGCRRERQGYFDEEGLERYLAAMPAIGAAILKTAFRTGLRRDNVRLLRKTQIDWAADELAVIQKGGKPNRVIFPSDIRKLLEHWCAVSTGEFVFGSPSRTGGTPVGKTTLWEMMDEATRVTGMSLAGEKPNVHHARHGYAVAMLEKDAPLNWVQQQMGHDNIAQTAKYAALRGRARETMRAFAEKTVAQARAERLKGR